MTYSIYLFYFFLMTHNVVTFPTTENLNVSVTGKFTGNHFETHGFPNMEVVM